MHRKQVKLAMGSEIYGNADNIICMADLLDSKMPAGGDSHSRCAPHCQHGAPEKGPARCELWQEPEALHNWGLQGCLTDSFLPDDLIVRR